MGERRRARERALQALYQIDLASTAREEALAFAWTSSEAEDVPDARTVQFAKELVDGVCDNREELDRRINELSHHWRVDRMARVDRNILRLAVYELVCRVDAPKRVILNEAIELAKTFGAEDSSAFINGILDKVAQGIVRE